MSWDTNVYYNPENLSLRQVGMISDPNACYSFDDLVVWQHEDGRLFWASDSGCSCPSPFEDYNKLEDLNEIQNNSDFDHFCVVVNEHCNWGSPDNDNDDFKADKTELMAKVANLLRNR